VKNFVDNYEKKRKMEELNQIRKERYMENAKKSAIYPGLRNLGNTCFF
jgi:ubiquitin C-terminal hydrolase